MQFEYYPSLTANPMEIPDQLQCLYSAHLERKDGSYSIEIPEQELQLGEIELDETVRIALLSKRVDPEGDANEQEREAETEHAVSGPPVEEGEIREVEIEDVGEQGDGITRVERGFVVIVPDTEPGERVTIEIDAVRRNVAFGEVLDRQTHVS